MVSCQSDYSSSFESNKSPTEDIKPTYLVGYGSVPVTTSSETTIPKTEYDPYYSKMQNLKEPEIKVPKSEITSTSCCSVSGRNDLLVPKTENNPCRSSPTLRPGYESYLNQDSNSSSMSSVDAMSSRPHHQLSHHSVLSHHNPQQPGYGMEDSRQHQMSHR